MYLNQTMGSFPVGNRRAPSQSSLRHCLEDKGDPVSGEHKIAQSFVKVFTHSGMRSEVDMHDSWAPTALLYDLITT